MHQHPEMAEESRQARKAVIVGAVALGVAAIVEAVAAHSSASASVLADALHNAGDATTTVILLLAFALVAKPASARYSSGYGRAEDVATFFVVAVVAVSAAIAVAVSLMRLGGGASYHNVGLAVGAALLSMAINWGVGRYKLKVGRKIGSSALMADGVHSRIDALASAGAATGIGLAGLGLQWADPVLGLVIAALMIWMLRGTLKGLYERMMEAVEPELLERVRVAAGRVAGVQAVHDVQGRWVGRRLIVNLHIDCRGSLSLLEAASIVRQVEEAVCLEVPSARLEIHADPDRAGYHAHHHADQHGAASS